MIIFHQGLPRSGKSYEAVKMILSELKKGRQVFTNIDGINFNKFSELSGISFDRLKGDIFEVEISENQINDFMDVYSRVYTIAEDTPVCDKCGRLMQLKKARDYKRDKDLIDLPTEFWGCMAFPVCRSVKSRAFITKYFITKFSGFLFQLTRDDIPVIYSRVANNSTVIIDEVQDFFPAVTKPLDNKMTEFITQHGHRGINILLMGQDHRDCHSLFKRRIDKLIHFTKRDAVGMPNTYSWESYKLSIDKLVKLRSGSGKYEVKYFGLYKSHVDNSIDATNHKDNRTNVFLSSTFTFYIPLSIVAVFFAIHFLNGFFHPVSANVSTRVKVIDNRVIQSAGQSVGQSAGQSVGQSAGQSVGQSAGQLAGQSAGQSVGQSAGQSVGQSAGQSAVGQSAGQSILKTAPIVDSTDYFKRVADKYELQLSGIIEGLDSKGNFNFFALIDALDDSHHIKERFSVKELRSMGWIVERTEYGVLIVQGKTSYIVRQRPRDYFGQVAQSVAHSSSLNGGK